MRDRGEPSRETAALAGFLFHQRTRCMPMQSILSSIPALVFVSFLIGVGWGTIFLRLIGFDIVRRRDTIADAPGRGAGEPG